ncbi:MAG: hypothetical protein LBH28_08725, partial [Oscillospiraceae bacterium]|nr:hypothetical protein [Oscillospiraceae bacterium]
MKRKRLPSLIGGVLVAALLLSMVVLPVGVQAAPTTYTALNPLGRIEAPDNQPLAERIGTLAGKTVGLVCWQTSTEGTGRFGGGALFMTGLKATLGAGSYVDRVIGLHFEQKEAWYDELADAVDAVVFAVAEDNMTAYWGAVHVRELEKRGVPCTIVVTNRFEETLKLAAEDHGITALRSVVIDKVDYSNAFYRNETIGGVTFAARQTNLVNVARPGITDALTTALTAAETAPGAIVPQNALADFTYAVGNATSSELGNYAEATAKFNADANAFGFGDGLELILPTRAAVDEMLAATTREPDEILGNIRMRNGVCTIEKVAINAVMAGAKPEYFPVIIAVMEVMAQGAEDYSYYYHA